jgi:diaminopimelate decarboxylase
MKKISGNRYIKKKGNILYLDDIEMAQILKYSDTPLMIFLEARIRENIKNFKRLAENEFKKASIFYSFKANYLYEICEIIKSEGIGAELISIPELNLAHRLKYPPEKILAGGPYLDSKFIEQCIINEIEEIVVYSISDINRINSIAKKYNKIQNLCLRINSQKYDSRLGMNLFNYELNQISLYNRRCKNIQFRTILSHYSTQMNNLNQFTKNAEILIEAFNKLHNVGVKIKNINFGGGFPEAAIMPQSQLKVIFSKIHNILKDQEIDYEEIYFEPGRFLVGDTGIFIAEIIKKTKDRWIFLNIGNNICPKFSKSSFRFYNASKIDQSHKYKTSIAGIIPTDQDVLVKNYFFNNDIEVGDKVLITNAGAYTLTFSNRFPYELPSIFLINGERINKIFDPSKDHDFSLRLFPA